MQCNRVVADVVVGSECSCSTQFRPSGAVNIVAVVAVLLQELGIAGVEGEAVSAGLERRYPSITGVVFVAGDRVGVKAELVWTLIVSASARCD